MGSASDNPFKDDFLSGLVRVEPAAAVRDAANKVRQLHVAFLETGFDEEQALALTAHCLTLKQQGGAG